MAAKLLNKESEDKIESAPIEEISKEEISSSPPEPESKFASKSREDLEKMLSDQEVMIGRQSQEVRDARQQIDAYKQADSFIQGQLQEQKSAEPKEALDYFGDPERAIKQSIEDHPALKQTQEELLQLRLQNAAQQIMARHPDMVQIVQDQKFVDWVSQDNTRMRLFNEANHEMNIESANYIFNEWKRTNATSEKPVEKTTRSESVRAASTGSATGSSEPVSKKRYRASDIRRLKIEDPKAYSERSAEIMKAYQEGRVIRN